MRILAVVLASAVACSAAAQMQVPQSQAEIGTGFVPVVQKVTPAVVNIYARRLVSVRSSPFENDPFFANLFRNFGTTRQRYENSLGSGVILSEDGIIVSNHHVISGATDVRVVLSDGREYTAQALLADQESDLAILRVEGAEPLPALTLRDSDTVEVGELVLAVGNPFGIGQTVSSGIVSGLARSGTATGNQRGYFIQTDAPINPGNSGGALVDVNGRLIGINTSILSRSGGSNGIGFAIPSSLVAQFVEQARSGKSVFQRPWAGITAQPVTADIAANLGLARPVGVIVSEIHLKSPFYAAGVLPGDLIASVNGRPLSAPAEMIYRMSIAGVGSTMDITLIRDGAQSDVTVALSDPPNDPPRNPMVTGEDAIIPGMALSTVNPAVIVQYGLPLSSTGVVVDDPGEAGLRLGLRQGDVLQSVNGAPISDGPSVEALLAQTDGSLRVEFRRGGQSLVLSYGL